MNKKKSILESNVLYTIIAIVIGFLVGAIFLTIAGISPAVAYGKLFSSIFSKPKYLVWTLVYAAPLIFTGLSVAFSFRTGVFNIGAEGQFVIGGLVACILGITLKLPAGIHALVCLVAAAAAGCIWSLIVGVLKVKRGIHEVLSFIMFNWIAFYLSNYTVNLPFIHRDKTEATQDIAASARLLLPESMRSVLGCSSAHWGFVLAVIDYPGTCACPFNTARNGSSCGGRSAWSKAGGYSPICYKKEVTKEMVKAWRQENQ